MVMTTEGGSPLIRGSKSMENIRYPLKITRGTVCDGVRVSPGDVVNASSLYLLKKGKAVKAGSPFIDDGRPFLESKKEVKPEPMKELDNRSVGAKVVNKRGS
tara:strand:- start:177 stop:482 length:306 start_codon:yes stop_codon:yes gene_type:complete